MHAEDRLIHFSTEMLHPPVQHPKAQLQKLYFELAQAKAGYDNIDLTLPGQPKFFARRGLRSQSVAVFLPDRIALIEEWTDIPLSEFLVKVREVLRAAFDVLGITTFPLQVVTLRSTFALTHFQDARVFLLDHVCNQAGRFRPFFERPIGIGGLRLVLPQVPGHADELHVAMESFRHDPKEILVEVKGIYPGAPLSRETAAAATERIEAVRAVITDSVFPFLDQYDHPDGNP
jgi:hypothetical protein